MSTTDRKASAARSRSLPLLLSGLTATIGLIAVLLLALPALAQDKEDAVLQSVAILRAKPDDAPAREALRRVFTEAYPRFLPADILTFLPIPYQVCEDRGNESDPPQRAFFTTGLAFPDAGHRQDPDAGQPFNRVLHAYVQEAEGEWRLAFRVLYDAHQEGSQELAARAMRELIRVRAAAVSHVGDPRKALSQTVDLWVRGDGDGGAEQSGPNLYLLGSRKPRQPLELLRQIAHEYGHLAFPGLGPFTQPEEWGNGFLGEVLILRWLSQSPAAPDALVPAAALAAYVRQDAEPLARAFAAAGWAGFSGEETTAGSLRLLLGMVLHYEDAHGTKALSHLLRSVRGTTVRDWIAAARPLLTQTGEK